MAVGSPKVARRCWQTNANQSQFCRGRGLSSNAELTPLGKCGGAARLEDVPAGKAAFPVGVIVDGGINGGEDLQTSYQPEA